MIAQNNGWQSVPIGKLAGFYAFLLATALIACTSVPDAEIAGSGLVAVSSYEVVKEKHCSFLQKYRVNTSADFATSLDIFKRRAFSFGGNTVVITFHNERDTSKGNSFYNKYFAGARKSLGFDEKEIVSIVEGDVFICASLK